MKTLKYFGGLIVRGTVIGLVAGFVLSYTAQRPQAVKEDNVVVQKQETIISGRGGNGSATKPDEVIPGVPKVSNPSLDEFANRLMKEATVDELKQAYKNCNRTLMEGKLSHGGIQMCGIVYETLKKKGFDDDYLKFHEWSKTWK